MSQSIKFKNGVYMDSEGVYDSTLNLEQSVINQNLMYYKRGDTILIPNKRFIAFGNDGGSSYDVDIFLPKIFEMSFEAEPSSYSGGIYLTDSSTEYLSSQILVSGPANTNLLKITIRLVTSTGGSFRHGVWIPDSSLTLTIT